MFNNYYDPTTFTLKLIKPRMVVCDGRGRERERVEGACVCVKFDPIIFWLIFAAPHPFTHPSMQCSDGGLVSYPEAASAAGSPSLRQASEREALPLHHM